MESRASAHYVVNVAHQMFLDTDGTRVWTWNNGGRDVNTVIAQNTSRFKDNIRWRIIRNAHVVGTNFILNVGHGALLKASSEDIVLNPSRARGHNVAEAMTDVASRNEELQWRLVDCPHQLGTYYIVNCQSGKFLDAHGREYEDVKVWNNGGRDVERVIRENISRHAGNLRWRLLPIERAYEDFGLGCTSLQAGTPPELLPMLSLDPPATLKPSMGVRIVHLSDTHNMHRQVGALPEGDILIHTGDFSDHGSPNEIADFDAWLGEVGQCFRHVLLIPGNHDWWHTVRNGVGNGSIDPSAAVEREFMQKKFKNCRVLIHEEVDVDGLRIFGSAWAPWQQDGSPDRVGKSQAHVETGNAWTRQGGSLDAFELIPDGIDILLTHGPAINIMDCSGSTSRGRGWGSSKKLFQAIMRAKPRAHFFGHLHEQRGIWIKGESGFEGGIEYQVTPSSLPFQTIGPPPPDYPCEVVSCNAMCSHPRLDGTGVNQIAGPARVIHMFPRQ